MRRIPASPNAQFNTLLVKNKIPQKYQIHYLKWLRYYLDFCHKYGLSESSPQNLSGFIRQLKEKMQKARWIFDVFAKYPFMACRVQRENTF